MQVSKIIRGREEWREKAVRRANEVRELRKNQRRYQDKISELKEKIRELESNAAEKKS